MSARLPVHSARAWCGALLVLVACTAGPDDRPPDDPDAGPPDDAAVEEDAGGDPAEPEDGGPTCADGRVPADETCNRIDDDCDGTTDEGCECEPGTSRPCGTDEGACVAGVDTCDAGLWSGCAGEEEPVAESCNGEDDDCDGAIDDGCDCVAGDTRTCGTDEGPCHAGTQTCVRGAWGTCADEIAPGLETCDGTDEDCDGEIDEGYGVGDPCDGPDDDACLEGTIACAAGGIARCDDFTSGVRDNDCDGDDDDCDGGIDEDMICFDCCDAPGDADACTEDYLFCGGLCMDVWGEQREACNGLDDDCDGAIDEDFGVGEPCDGPDADDCAEGVLGCNGCDDASGDAVESCNGLDDDCDGSADEGLGVGLPCDGADTDLCEDDRTSCSGCEDAGGSLGELCGDGLDNDCDGLVDEDFDLGTACDGPDADLCTEGVSTCNGCDDATGDVLEVCNGLDDDCDGSVDEGFGVGLSCDGSDDDACADDVGSCAGCEDVGGSLVEGCNGIDDDCDGTIDEDFGGCSGCCDADGDYDLCSDDAWTCNGCIDAGVPHPELCGNGLDDDCDGAADEHQNWEECGNGTDDDCDGAVDERGCLW